MHAAIPCQAVPKPNPWNKARLIGQSARSKRRTFGPSALGSSSKGRARDLALFNLAIGSKLRGCDLVRLMLEDVCAGGRVRERATIVQRKTGRPVQFEITEQTRASIRDWLATPGRADREYLFPTRVRR